MTDLKELKHKRAMVKGQMTRLVNFLEMGVQRTVAEARVRKEKLEECWKKFDEYQYLIETRPTESDEDYERQRRDGEAERQVFEESYYTVAERLDEIINHNERIATPPNGGGNQGQQIIVEAPRSRPKLPEIKLPEFDGDYSKWLFFKNSFEATIHSETQLTPMQKHQYLIGVLKNEALKVIQGYQISNENYTEAWKLLKDTYDNKIIIIETHLDELLQFPSITKENKAEDIRKFVWHIRTHMSSLKVLGQPVDKWETMVIHLAKKKLEFVEQRDWQDTIKNRNPENMPTMEEFLKFLTDRCNTLRVLNQGKSKPTTSKQQQTRNEKKVTMSTFTNPECKVCKGSHSIYRCEELQKLSPEERKKSIISLQLCINCLGSGHIAKNCKSSSCKKCSRRHNTLLHREDGSQSKEKSEESSVSAMGACDIEKQATSFTKEKDTMNICCAQRTVSTVIQSTAVIKAQDAQGNTIECRVLLDPGSQSNIVTEGFARKLGLPSQREDRKISGINLATSNARKVMKIRIQSMHKNFSKDLEFLMLPTITRLLPRNQIDVKRIALPKNVRLADPKFEEPGKIDMLLGAGIYWKILVGSPKNQNEGQPSLQNTLFGWIVGGEMTEKESKSTLIHVSITNDMLQQQIENFWRQEEILEPPKCTEEEEFCEEYFSKTLERQDDGRFIVRLPKRENIELGDSREQATRRLHALERRFAKNPQLQTEYVRFMDDYIEQQHMSVLREEKQGSETYTLPHQAIVRPDSLTTKLRVVFDASAKTTNGTSLNDKLIPGPNLQRDLQDISLRFRTHEYVMTADVAKMYRQIQVNPQDRALQKIVWRRDPRDAIRVFEPNTVTYGTSCAPYFPDNKMCVRKKAAALAATVAVFLLNICWEYSSLVNCHSKLAATIAVTLLQKIVSSILTTVAENMPILVRTSIDC